MRPLRTLFLLIAAILPASRAAAQADTAIVRYLSEDYNVRFQPGNAVRILPSALQKYAALEEDLRRARHAIHMDYFAIRYDSISRVVFDILREKARQGVEVRIVDDAFGNGKGEHALTDEQIRDLREEGIDVRIFSPFRFPWLNHVFHRDHRKIVVIDGTVGYIGGMNVADYYIHGKGQVKEWRDMHLRIAGPAVSELQRVFINFWNSLTDEQVGGEAYYRMSFDMEDAYRAGPALIGVTNRTPSRGNDWPTRNNRIARDAACKAIDEARHHIQIVNPYFAPSPKVWKALRRALKRGVDVELMISAQGDVPFTQLAVEHSAYRLMKRGARVYVYEPGFHHSKVMTIDNHVSYVGSVNFDHRSLYSDYECNVMIVDSCAAHDLQAVFEADKARSFRLTPETRKTRYTPWRRFRGRLTTLFRPLL
ncbi:MAG: phospholipase D-like domain-containing protein [Bacteroidaceae bacterium]|nr:phospholipase D-like domain-containing protein [Bacteroidaceae bacterium]